MIKDENSQFKVKKPRNIAQVTHIFENFEENIALWNDLRIWNLENDESYSKWFRQELQRIRVVVINFVKEGYSSIISEENGFKYQFLRNLAYWITEHENILPALFQTNGWKGKLGLEYAAAQIRIFKKEAGRNPVQRDSGFNGVQKALKKGYWKEYNITSWNDLLLFALGEVNQEYGIYDGTQGLNRVIQELLKFYENNKRIPTARDDGMSQFTSAITRGVWKAFGISTWNDLLEYVFKDINKESSLYTGQEGLVRAKKAVKDYYTQHKRMPQATDPEMQSIYSAFKRKYWSMYGINTWNDLLWSIFGKVNKTSKIWTGKAGYERAKEKLRNFFIDYGRKPTRREMGFGGLVKAIQRGYWKDFGINSWNNLLLDVFGEVNQKGNS